MLEKYTDIHLKKDTFVNSKAKIYSLTSDQHVIGTVEETVSSSRNFGNRLFKLFSLFQAASLEMKLLDSEAQVLGVIKKEKGLSKNIYLFSSDGEKMAVIQPAVRKKSPTITVTDVNGDYLMKAEGNYGATDFSVMGSQLDRQVAYLKKRPVDNLTMKEQLFSDGVFYNIDNKRHECTILYSLIAICITVDLYSQQ